MRHEEQVRLTKEMLARLDAGVNVDAGGIRRNPTWVYVDADLAQRERASLFAHHPQIVGLSGDLPEPGAYLTVDDLPVPIIVTRAASGEVMALVNACRHRGARLLDVDDRGRTRRFTCDFHGWSYSTDGTLVGLPKRDHFGNIDEACHGLARLPALERHGLVWVHPDPEGTIDPEALLTPELADELDHWRLGELRHLDRDRYDVECNWKLAMDTFGETYHFPALHRNTIDLAFHGNVQCYDTFGRNHRMLLCRRDIDQMRTRPEHEWDITVATLPAYWLFPNVQLLPFHDGCYLVRAYPHPTDPSRHTSHITFYLRPDVVDAVDTTRSDEQRSLAELFASIIRDEDYVMSASQQRTASSGALPEVVFGRNEPALHHYHNTFRDALGLDRLPLLPAGSASPAG